VSTARDLARLYAACVSDVDGPRLLTPTSVDDAVIVRSHGQQLFGPPDSGRRWGTGFMLHSPPIRLMLGDRSFGHDGAGGHMAFADDTHHIGFAYTLNHMANDPDDRSNRLTTALLSCLD
jgi:CubicO group peptidase (beta-lactamase class C family)